MNSKNDIEVKLENDNQDDKMDLKDKSKRDPDMIYPIQEENESKTENKKNKVFTSKDPKQINECDLCKKCFSTAFNLKRHLKSHTGAKSFECKSCDKKFKENHHLKYHQTIHTREKAIKYLKTNSNKMAYSKCENDEEASMKCTICGKTFPRRGSLVRHNRLLHSSGKMKYNIPSEQPVDCQLCGKRFSKKSNMKAHQLSVHSISSTIKPRKILRIPQDCDECQKTFKSKELMLKHKARKHNQSKNAKCDICEKTFHHKSNLLNHNRLMHQYDTAAGTKRNYNCHLCEKTYKSYAGLYVHNNIHHKKSTRCDICDKGFAKPFDLKRHFQDWHTELEDPLDFSVVQIEKTDPDPLEIKQEPLEMDFVVKKEEI